MKCPTGTGPPCVSGMLRIRRTRPTPPPPAPFWSATRSARAIGNRDERGNRGAVFVPLHPGAAAPTIRMDQPGTERGNRGHVRRTSPLRRRQRSALSHGLCSSRCGVAWSRCHPASDRPSKAPAAATIPAAIHTLAKCDRFGTPSTSHWTGAAIIVQSCRMRTCIVTTPKTSTRPMRFSLVG
jgi:hypothetical protein